MKQFWLYSGFFVFFAGSLGAVRFLDDYSSRYKSCSEAWRTSIEAANKETYLAPYLLERLDNQDMAVAGEACPKLIESHAQRLKARLDKIYDTTK